MFRGCGTVDRRSEGSSVHRCVDGDGCVDDAAARRVPAGPNLAIRASATQLDRTAGTPLDDRRVDLDGPCRGAARAVPRRRTRSATPIGSDQARTARRSNLIETEGYSVLALLLFPIVVAAVAFIARPDRWRRQVRIACATLLAAFCVLGIASVGFPYIPAALAILRAGSRTESIAARR